jgi:putative phosphoesterase
MIVGVISDTHGLLREEALLALDGVEHILHAGDVGDIRILESLRAIAPVTAIRGNVDGHGDCAFLPPTEVVELGGRTFYMLHALAELDIHPHAAGIDAVVYGHSHKSVVDKREGVLYLNPGSAGPRRFQLPVTVALVHIDEQSIRAEIVTLPV